jgi:hypothetical protein
MNRLLWQRPWKKMLSLRISLHHSDLFPIGLRWSGPVRSGLGPISTYPWTDWGLGNPKKFRRFGPTIHFEGNMRIRPDQLTWADDLTRECVSIKSTDNISHYMITNKQFRFWSWNSIDLEYEILILECRFRHWLFLIPPFYVACPVHDVSGTHYRR